MSLFDKQPMWYALSVLSSDVNVRGSNDEISSADSLVVIGAAATVIDVATNPTRLIAGTPYATGRYIITKHNDRPAIGSHINVYDSIYVMFLPEGDWSLATAYFQALASGVIDGRTPKAIRSMLLAKNNRARKGGRR